MHSRTPGGKTHPFARRAHSAHPPSSEDLGVQLEDRVALRPAELRVRNARRTQRLAHRTAAEHACGQPRHTLTACWTWLPFARRLDQEAGVWGLGIGSRADWVAAVCLLGRGEDCVPVGPAEPHLDHTLIEACDPTLAGERLAPGVAILLRPRTPAGFVVQCKRMMATAIADRTSSMTMTRPMSLSQPEWAHESGAVIMADRSTSGGLWCFVRAARRCVALHTPPAPRTRSRTSLDPPNIDSQSQSQTQVRTQSLSGRPSARLGGRKHSPSLLSHVSFFGEMMSWPWR